MANRKYTGILFPVVDGQVISVAGKIASNPRRFDINLSSIIQAGSTTGDIQLHFSVRFHATKPVILRNNHIQGIGWGTDESHQNLIRHNKPNPFNETGDFKIDFFVDEAAFFVTINGKPYCTFNHRMPYDRIEMISVFQDVDAIYQVNQFSTQINPWPAFNPNTFEAFVPAQFSPGNLVAITAIPKGSNGDFSVNFYDGSNKSRTHFHVRAYLNNRTVVFNSQKESGHWDVENIVSPQPYPFNLETMFKLTIAMTDYEFQVAVNGIRLFSMPFRDSPSKIFASMTGITLDCGKGLNMQLKSVDFIKLDRACYSFEEHSQF